jgi:hypothetical protein
MPILFEGFYEEPTEVEFGGETFVVFGHIQIGEADDLEEETPDA